MSYNIGQFRRGKQNFLVDMSGEGNDNIRLDYIQDNKFTVSFVYPCLKIINTAMSNNSSYYLQFSVNQLKNSEQKFSLIIKHDGDEETAQILHTYIVPAGNKTSYFEIAFSPLEGEYNQIHFELYRTTVDFETHNDDKTMGRKMIVGIENFSRVSNILDMIQIPKITKLGIQAAPGQLFVIDGEQIRIGRTGMYELYRDDITISFIGAIVKSNSNSPIPDKRDLFIIDYKY